MYKDKDKQREANRERQRRHRAEAAIIEGIVKKHFIEPEGVTGCDKKGVTNQDVTNQDVTRVDKALICIRDEFKPERTERGNIRVSKLGDDDYVPQCETTKAFIDGRPKRPAVRCKRCENTKAFIEENITGQKQQRASYGSPTGASL